MVKTKIVTKKETSFKNLTSNFLKVKANQNILIHNVDLGFIAPSKMGESLSKPLLIERINRLISAYVNAGEIPDDINIKRDVKIIKQTWNPIRKETFKVREKGLTVGTRSVRVARDSKGRFLSLK